MVAVPTVLVVDDDPVTARVFARVLEEHIVASAGSLDLAMIMGTGFPPFRGGLLRHADSIGAKAVLDGLHDLQRTYGSRRFAPSSLITELAADGRRFYQAFP